MNDDHLLRSAARAYKEGLIEAHNGYWIDGNGAVWNPLDDDAAAFDLAVKLSFAVEVLKGPLYAVFRDNAYVSDGHVDVWERRPRGQSDEAFLVCQVLLTEDNRADVRRAIVRGAAYRMGWPMGLEPTTAGITIQSSTN